VGWSLKRVKPSSADDASPVLFSVRVFNGMSRMSLHRRSTTIGFTVVELIVVITIAGIIALVALPRFVGVDSFQSRGFYDEAQGVVRYAQKIAIAWRKPVFVCVTATNVSAHSAAGCASQLPHPVTGGLLKANAPNGVILSAANFSFDSAGRPNPNTAVTITIAGDPARRIVVEAETGYVHP
jgi:MSHA pilin protein MshC